MNLTNYYYYFQSVIPERICNDIVRYGKQLQDQMAITGGFSNRKLNQREVKDLKKKRNSDIVWMSDRWIYNEIQPYINQANASAGWNFQFHQYESFQFTEYKKNQYYKWHHDSFINDTLIRKLSGIITLSDPKDYVGGELEIKTPEN